jgi:hypothetical protein
MRLLCHSATEDTITTKEGLIVRKGLGIIQSLQIFRKVLSFEQCVVCLLFASPRSVSTASGIAKFRVSAAPKRPAFVTNAAPID